MDGPAVTRPTASRPHWGNHLFIVDLSLGGGIIYLKGRGDGKEEEEFLKIKKLQI